MRFATCLIPTETSFLFFTPSVPSMTELTECCSVCQAWNTLIEVDSTAPDNSSPT